MSVERWGSLVDGSMWHSNVGALCVNSAHCMQCVSTVGGGGGGFFGLGTILCSFIVYSYRYIYVLHGTIYVNGHDAVSAACWFFMENVTVGGLPLQCDWKSREIEKKWVVVATIVNPKGT